MGDSKGNDFASFLPDITIPAELFWEGTFDDYIGKVLGAPRIVRTAHQRMYDMITYYGQESYKEPWERDPVTHYRIFDDPFTENNKYAVYGADIWLMSLVNTIRASADKLGPEHRIVLLEGPVGTAKSTIGELLACGLEDFSTKPEGAYYSTFWVVGEDSDQVVSKDAGALILGTIDESRPHRFDCQMHEQPLRVIPTKPINIRKELIDNVNQFLRKKYVEMTQSQLVEFLGVKGSQNTRHHYLEVNGNACPRCNEIFWKLTSMYQGDWRKVLENHLRVKRTVMSRDQRIGIAITRPKSEKDQDATEWSGETNYRALGKFGSTTDPRSFDFTGYFQQANGGMLYSEELLKLSHTFLYDYLGASQEHRVKPKGMNETDIDEFILGSTNETEYNKLKETKEMEALRDRIIKIPCPYIDNYLAETKIYKKFFYADRDVDKHLAPHSLAIAAFWSVITRLKDSKNIKIVDKAKLYAGKSIEGFNDETRRELRKEAEGECRDGISPRYTMDRIADTKMETFTFHEGKEKTDCINPFAILRHLEEGLTEHPNIVSVTQKQKFSQLVSTARSVLEDWIRTDVQEVIVGDESAVREILNRYLANLLAKKNNGKVLNDIDELVPPDENFLRSIEGKAKKNDESTREEFRQKIILNLAMKGGTPGDSLDINFDEVLKKAAEDYLFDQEQRNLDWQALTSKQAAGKEGQANIAHIMEGLIKKGYCPTCAKVSLTTVAGIFVRNSNK